MRDEEVCKHKIVQQILDTPSTLVHEIDSYAAF